MAGPLACPLPLPTLGWKALTYFWGRWADKEPACGFGFVWWVFPVPGWWGWQSPWEGAATSKPGTRAGEGACIPLSEQSILLPPAAGRCRGFVVVAGLRFGLKARTCCLECCLPAASCPLPRNKALHQQESPLIPHPSLHPGMLGGRGCFSHLGFCWWCSRVLEQRSEAELYPSPALSCCQSAGPGCPSRLAHCRLVVLMVL